MHANNYLCPQVFVIIKSQLTMMQYNNVYLLFVGYYQIYQLFPFKTMIIAGEWI